MAGRIRSIKPEILEDEGSASLTDSEWRLWVSMWLIADDFGNLRGDPRRLAADVWWATVAPPNVPEVLAELERKGRILRYEVRGQKYIAIVNWSKHQRIDNAGKARVPGPAEVDARGDSPRPSEPRGSDHDHEGDREREEGPTTHDRARANGAGFGEQVMTIAKQLAAAWPRAGLPGLPGASQFAESAAQIVGCGTTYTPTGYVGLCKSFKEITNAYLKQRGSIVQANPEKFLKHLPTVIRHAAGEIDLSQLGAHDKPKAQQRQFNDGIGAQPATVEED